MLQDWLDGVGQQLTRLVLGYPVHRAGAGAVAVDFLRIDIANVRRDHPTLFDQRHHCANTMGLPPNERLRAIERINSEEGAGSDRPREKRHDVAFLRDNGVIRKTLAQRLDINFLGLGIR